MAGHPVDRHRGDTGSPPPWLTAPAARTSVVGAAAALVLLVNLGSAPLWDDDEPKNTACTLAMLAHGDWIVPRFNEDLRTDKPPLVNWLQMAGFALLGRNEAGARIASALLTVGSSLLTAGLAARLFPSLPAVGLWSGLAMGTCAWSAVAGRSATPDAGLCFCTTLTLFAASRRRSSPALALATGLAIGGALLAKGPVGYVLPMAALGLAAWWQAIAEETRPSAHPVRRLAAGAVSAWRMVRPLVVTAAALAVAGPWYALVADRTGGEWLEGFLFTHNLGRFAAPMEGHAAPFFSYGLVLLAGLFPWSIVAGVTAAALVRGVRSGPDAAPLRLLVSWIVVWVGCFSLSGTKLPGYIWPAYPAAAVAVGWFLERWRLGLVPAHARWMPLAWGSLAAAGVAIVVGLLVAAESLGTGVRPLAALGVVPIIAAAAAWRHAAGSEEATRVIRIRGRTAALGWVAAGACLSIGPLAALGPDRVGRASGVRPLVQAAGASRMEAPWARYACSVPSLVYYCGAAERGERVPRLVAVAEAEDFFLAHPDGLVVAPAGSGEELLAVAPSGHAILGRSTSLTSHRALVLVGPARREPHGPLSSARKEMPR